MTDSISFLSRGNFFDKIYLKYVFIITNQQTSGNEKKIEKNPFVIAFARLGQNCLVIHDSKSFDAFNFIGIVVLTLRTNSHKLILEMLEHAT